MIDCNPFLFIPTLQTFARDVAAQLIRGACVLAVIGPYDPEEFRVAVERFARMELPVDEVPVFEGTSLVQDHRERLALVRSINLSAQIVSGTGVEGWSGQVLWCPMGLTLTELRGLAFRMISNERGLSASFRTMVIDYACELCCGSVEALKDVLEVCLDEAYRPPRAFVHPRDVVRECALRQRRTTQERLLLASGAPAPSVRDFRLQLMRSLSTSDRLQGAEEPYAPSGKLFLMWRVNWSYGLCSNVDGVWYPNWETVLEDASAWVPETGRGIDVSQAEGVFADVCNGRFSRAMQVAFMPVWERYKSAAVARLIDTAASASDEVGRFDNRNERGQGKHGLICRSDDIGCAYAAAAANPDAWKEANGTKVPYDAMKYLRNHVLHANVDKTRYDLSTLGLMLDELAAFEREAYYPRNRRCFG